MTIDLLPTIAKLIGAELPRKKIDGLDIGPLLRGESGAKCPHEVFFHYYQQGELQAVRSGKWKLMLPHTYRTMEGQAPGKDGQPGKYRQVKITKPELYDLDADVNETRNVADANPEVVKKLLAFAEAARDDLGDSLTKHVGKGVREPGRLPPVKKPLPPTPSPKGRGSHFSPSPRLYGGEGRGEGGFANSLVLHPSPPTPLPSGERGARQSSSPLGGGVGEGSSFASELVFPLHKQHNHAPGIVECPNGDLLVSWYRGSGERSADDVAVYRRHERRRARRSGATPS